MDPVQDECRSPVKYHEEEATHYAAIASSDERAESSRTEETQEEGDLKSCASPKPAEDYENDAARLVTAAPSDGGVGGSRAKETLNEGELEPSALPKLNADRVIGLESTETCKMDHVTGLEFDPACNEAEEAKTRNRMNSWDWPLQRKR